LQKHSFSNGSQAQRRRFFTDEKCKEIAGRISIELRDYAEHKDLERRGHLPNMILSPVVPIWGPDYDTVVHKVNLLFHPDEAAIIVEHLTA
jgi:hypothetical protein